MTEKNTNLQAVIFDMDGLMFDTERLAMDIWVEVGKDNNLPISKELALRTVGTNWELTKDMMSEVLGESNYIRARKLWQESMQDYMEKNGLPEKEGLRDLLHLLGKLGIKKAVATSSYEDEVKHYLERADLERFFDVVVNGEMVTNGKPSPDIFLHAAKLLDVSPDNCIVLEDSFSGIKAAHAAKIRAIMIPDLFWPDDEINELLYRRCDSLLEVKTLIESNNCL